MNNNIYELAKQMKDELQRINNEEMTEAQSKAILENNADISQDIKDFYDSCKFIASDLVDILTIYHRIMRFKNGENE